MSEVNKSASPEAGSGWWSMAALALVGILTIRWAPLAWGTGDYGWTYEAAWRIAHGEVPYRDFFSTLPPLTNFSLALAIQLCGDSLWLNALHLYFWWAAGLGLGWLFARQLGLSRAACVWTIFTGAWVSLPADGLGHAYGYESTVVAGLALLCVLRDSTPLTAGRAWGAGLLTGLCIITKQNVGIFLVPIMGILLGLQSLAANDARNILKWLICYMAGLGVGAGVPFLLFCVNADPSEVFRHLLLDAGSGKGGVLKTAARGLPRFFILPGVNHKYLIEIALSVPLLVGLAWWMQRKLVRSHLADTEAGLPTRLPVVVFVVLSTCLLFGSLIDAPFIRQAQERMVVPGFLPFSSMLVQFIYIVIIMSAGVAALHAIAIRDWQLAALSGAVAGLLYAHATSSLEYLRYAAPVALPLAAVLWRRVFGAALTLRMLQGMAFAAAVVFTAFPMYAKNFERIRRIEGPPAFATLYARNSIWEGIEVMRQEWHPRIAGRRTLWLLEGGPHAATGGLPVRNVVSYYLDSYSSRLEDRLFAGWDASPPECVVVGHFARAPGADRLLHENILRWLRLRYTRVWGSEQAGQVSIWHLRDSPARSAAPENQASR